MNDRLDELLLHFLHLRGELKCPRSPAFFLFLSPPPNHTGPWGNTEEIVIGRPPPTHGDPLLEG